MGRPLFSSLYKNDIRIVPTPTPEEVSPSEQATKHQAEEKKEEFRTWSIEHPFDPDSDEFFNGPDAVYEAFLEEGEGDHPAPADEEEDGEEEGEEQRVVPPLLPISSIPIRDANEEEEEEREIVEQPSPMAVGSMTDEHESALATGYAYILRHEANYVSPQHSSYSSSRHQITRSAEDGNRLVWTTDILPIPARPATPPSSSRSRNLLFSSTMNLWDGHFANLPMTNPDARVSMSHLRPVRNVAA